VAQRVGRGIALIFYDRGTRRGERSAARPDRTLPSGKTRYPFYRRLLGPQGRSGRAENLAHYRDSIPDRPVCSQSLYRLNYPPPHTHTYIYIYRVSQEECARLRESVPYVKVYRYNPKYLYPKLNGYGDNGQKSLKL